ncbi:hypothetical protein A0H81_10342 [Grifola frondosa]|uniref:T6SS Phospholipase effector Tle1-like catalytic domain-containing protein n=1 Tax=Grifola frondosa TaxID=5627 RepID=A0A1C7LY67_GRIFR|nr:hypothetical protein A0H81_10342 [Grifola frondosa]
MGDQHFCKCFDHSDSVRQTGRNLVARNIDQLHKKLVKDKTQLTYYNSGVGTFMPPSTLTLRYWKRRIDGTLNLQIAWDFDRIIKEAYRWLAENYQDGDVIYCFGYSRGALLVLTLAEMIAEVGLIHKGTEEQLAYVYALYIDPNSHITPVNGSESMAQQFKQAHSRNVRVHFVGVCRLGMQKRDANRSNSPQISVRDFKAAVKSSESENSETRSEGKDNPAAPRVKEVWFSGTHRVIGGGNVENQGFQLHSPSFLWMLYEATSLRLKLNTTNMEYKWHELGNAEELLRGAWNFMEFLPMKRATSDDALRFTRV